MNDFERGLLVGVLIGEGHFGGDGKQAQVTVRMHTRHQQLFQTLLRLCPGSRLYGPYDHGGRSYFQWMARGHVLKEQLLPVLDEAGMEQLDEHAWSRYQEMKVRYSL